MALNLLNDNSLNDFLTDISFQGNPQSTVHGVRGEYESVDYVVAHSDTIARGILNQYVKRKIRDYILNLKDEPAFVAIDAKQPDLPDWAKTVLARGEQIYLFNGAKMSDKLKNDITTVRDYLYDVALMYVDKVAKTAEATKQKPITIRYDYLKTTNEYNTFEQALSAAHKWHEKLAQNLDQKLKAKETLEKSQVGARFMMGLPDGMSAYQLTTAEALDFESEYMGHCVGKGGYDQGVKDGSLQIYSIRDEHGEPHVTFEVRNGTIQQCKGKQNKAPIAKYMPAVQAFIKQNKFKLGGDKRNTGLIEQDGEYYNLFHLPQNFVLRDDLDLSNMDLTELPDMSTVTVLGNFNCSNNKLILLKGRPKEVAGNFDCSWNQLTSLDGAPEKVEGNFDCRNNQLTTLVGAPERIGGIFDCSENQLTSLKGAPKEVSGDFNCSLNQLITLVEAPKEVGGDFICISSQLTSLKGAPEKVGGNFSCASNQLTTLVGAPKEVDGNFVCVLNQLTSLAGAPKEVGGSFICNDNQLISLNDAPEKVEGDFYCHNNQLTTLIGAPRRVGGEFDCSKNQLISLAGAPKEVGGSFICEQNQLISLNGAPEKVEGDFDCRHNQLTTLNGAPRRVGGHFYCTANQLTTLKGAPEKVGGEFNCSENQLTTLVEAPKEVGGNFICISNQLTSLKGAPEKIRGSFNCSSNQLTTLVGAPKEVEGYFDCSLNQLTSLKGAPEKIRGKILSDGNPLTPEKSIVDIFRQAEKNILTQNQQPPVFSFNSNHEI